MHYGWVALRMASSAVGVAYCVLYTLTAKRLRGWERTFVDRLLYVVVAFLAIRVFSRFVFLNLLAYRSALVVGGVAAATGVLIEVKALITQRKDDSKGRTESLS